MCGKRWNLRIVPNLGPDGDCDKPSTRGKEIRIAARLAGVDQLDTLIHEMIHAGGWATFDEAFVTHLAADIARVLWRLGYRKQDT